MILKTFNGDPKQKGLFLKKIKSKGVGCNIDCDEDHVNHNRFLSEVGLPDELVNIAETICECLPYSQKQWFIFDFYKAINVGSDLSDISNSFFKELLLGDNNSLISVCKQLGSIDDPVAEYINAMDRKDATYWRFKSQEGLKDKYGYCLEAMVNFFNENWSALVLGKINVYGNLNYAFNAIAWAKDPLKKRNLFCYYMGYYDDETYKIALIFKAKLIELIKSKV